MKLKKAIAAAVLVCASVLAAGGCICLFGTKEFAGIFNAVANLWYKTLPGLFAGKADRAQSA